MKMTREEFRKALLGLAHLKPANDKDAITKVAYVRCMDEFAVFNLN